MTFKEKLIRLRKIHSLTQDEFACAVGVSRQAVYKWESGQSYPEVAKLLEIKLLFGISIDDLLDDNFDIPLPKKKRKKRMTKEEKARIEALVNEEFAGAEDEGAPEEESAQTEESEENEENESSDENTEESAPEGAEENSSEEKPEKKGLFSRFSRK